MHLVQHCLRKSQDAAALTTLSLAFNRSEKVIDTGLSSKCICQRALDENSERTLSRSSEAFLGEEYGPKYLHSNPSLMVSRYIHNLPQTSNRW